MLEQSYQWTTGLILEKWIIFVLLLGVSSTMLYSTRKQIHPFCKEWANLQGNPLTILPPMIVRFWKVFLGTNLLCLTISYFFLILQMIYSLPITRRYFWAYTTTLLVLCIMYLYLPNKKFTGERSESRATEKLDK